MWNGFLEPCVLVCLVASVEPYLFQSHLSRCVRRALSFSKSLDILIYTFAAFIHNYNLTLKLNPIL